MSISTKLQSDSAYEILKQDILHIRIPPSTPLKISWLQNKYGFSIPELLQALTRLESEYLVILKSGKGFSVASVSITELMDLYKARIIIKQELLKQAMQLGDAAWENNIINTHYLLTREISPVEAHCSFNNYIAWKEAFDAFDEALIAAHRSPLMHHYHKNLSDNIRRHGRVFGIIMPSLGKMDFKISALKVPAFQALYSLDRYTVLKDAVLRRDFDLAMTLINEHHNFMITAYNELYEANISL